MYNIQVNTLIKASKDFVWKHLKPFDSIKHFNDQYDIELSGEPTQIGCKRIIRATNGTTFEHSLLSIHEKEELYSGNVNNAEYMNISEQESKNRLKLASVEAHS
jgi:hypothetical protein